MNAPSIRPIRSEDLTADGVVADGAIELTLRGAAEQGAKALLDDFLADVFAASRDRQDVVVDLRGLEYMNSSSFKSFLTWIVAVRELPDEQRHTIRFVSNPRLHWQKRSLHSLVSMGGDSVAVEEREPTS